MRLHYLVIVVNRLFSDIKIYKVVWQHIQGAVWFLITTLLQIYQVFLQLKSFETRFRFDKIMAMSLWLHFLVFGHHVGAHMR